jgi:ATP-binding cassette subfamily B protein IrtA
MGRGYQGAVLKALGVRDHELEVVAVKDVTAHYRRLRLRSATLFDDLDPGPTVFIRLWMPDLTEAGREHQRCYTVLDADPAAGELTLEFVLHEPHGPASAWAAAASPGSTVRAAAWASKKFLTPDPAPVGYLLVGDPAATPAINDLLAMIPAATPVELYLEWSHESDADIPVAEHPQLRIHRIRRDGAALAAAIEARDWSDWCAWVSGERKTVRQVREALRDVHGFPKSEVTATPYWIEGGSHGKSRDKAAAEPKVDVPKVEAPAERQWRSQAGRELLRPLRPTLRVAGILQALVTVCQLVPFLLLVDVSEDVLRGAPVDELWPRARVALWLLGGAATVSSGLLLWLHLVDARFGAEVRRMLLAKLARLPLGWFTERNSGAVKHLV